ncbi:hypothetical protein HDZ31DRAFT_83952 [Schizophyllum fasciatum]
MRNLVFFFLCPLGIVFLMLLAADPAASLILQPMQADQWPVKAVYYSLRDWWNHRTFDRDYWRELSQHAQNASKVAFGEIRALEKRFPEARDTLEEFVASVRATVDDAAQLQLPRNLTELKDEIGPALEAILQEAKIHFPPPHEAPGAEERRQIAEAVVGRATQTIERILVGHGTDAEHTHRVLAHMDKTLVHMIVLTGNLHEQHELLFDIAIFLASTLVAEVMILRPILGLLGFGPIGPVKGKPAAWMQRRLYGAVVKEGSWFSYLQRAGMKTATKAPGC